MEWLDELLRWFEKNGRKYFWRFDNDWYVTIVAEIMLVRTRASVVEKVVRDFLKMFPTPDRLCNAPEDGVEAFFRRLGLVKRGRWLRETVCRILQDWRGAIPCSEEILMTLPGVGKYLSRVLITKLCSAPKPFVDTNVLRVVTRFVGEKLSVDEVEEWIRNNVPEDKLYVANLALMDVGALLCKHRRPRCSSCPLSRWCRSSLARTR